MKTLQISEANARKLYKTATPEFKQTLEDTFGNEFFTTITSIEDCYEYEDCCKLLARKPMDIDALRAAGATEFGILAMQNETIVEAINNGEKPDMFNASQKKWLPWFRINRGSSGFAFDDAGYYYSVATAGCASRLCLLDETKSKFYAERFQSNIKNFMSV